MRLAFPQRQPRPARRSSRALRLQLPPLLLPISELPASKLASPAWTSPPYESRESQAARQQVVPASARLRLARRQVQPLRACLLQASRTSLAPSRLVSEEPQAPWALLFSSPRALTPYNSPDHRAVLWNSDSASPDPLPVPS